MEAQTVRIDSTRKNMVNLPPIKTGSLRMDGHAVEAEGITPLPKRYWDEVVKREDVKALLVDQGEGRLSVVEGTGSTRSAPETLVDMPDSQALVHINACGSAETLLKWCGQEKRRDILDAMTARMDIIESAQKRGEKVPAVTVVTAPAAGGASAKGDEKK